jgi:uncharacterized lipoprotein YehR (DUF1307 family)
MKKIFRKMFCLLLAVSVASVVLTSCGGGLPNGRYEPENESIKMSVLQAIIIKGDNFTMVMPMTGQGITLKYKYTEGTVTFYGEGAAAGQACEFKDGKLWYMGMPFTKTN